MNIRNVKSTFRFHDHVDEAILELFRLVFVFILSVVLYGCETWSLTLRKEYRLRIFRNKILRRIFGPKGLVVGSGEGSTIRNFIIICTVPVYSQDY